jgi:hypothetical protein
VTLELAKLSDLNNALLGAALEDGKSPLSVVIADDIDAREFLAFMNACVSTVVKLDRGLKRMGPLMGRGLALMSKRRDILDATGYASLREYEAKEITGKGLGSHGNVWDWKFVMEPLGDLLSQDQVQKIGLGKLKKAARALPDNASPKQKQEFIKQAVKAESVDAYQEWIERESGLSAPDATRFDKIELMGPGDQVKELREFLADGEFREWAGTDSALGMVLAAVQESAKEWDAVQLDEPIAVTAIEAPEEDEEGDPAPSDPAEDEWGP